MLLLVLACSARNDSLFDSFVEGRTQDPLGSDALVANGTADAYALGVSESLSVESADPDIVAAPSGVELGEDSAHLHLVTGVAGSTELSLLDDRGRVLDTVS